MINIWFELSFKYISLIYLLDIFKIDRDCLNDAVEISEEEWAYLLFKIAFLSTILVNRHL